MGYSRASYVPFYGYGRKQTNQRYVYRMGAIEEATGRASGDASEWLL